MRIIGGKYRGKKLWSPEGKAVRPTADRAREAVFNILYSHLGEAYENFDMADIFAGTGAFGLEAISRGFKSATLVDIDIKNAERNAKMFTAEQSKIYLLRASAENLPRLRRKFHLVFMDAPYNKGLTDKVLVQLIAKDWLHDGAVCIVEIRNDEKIVIPEEFEVVDSRVYGLARILFLSKK
jgi:16S rRNA (guanine966-N2)-methyltransferase